MTRTIFAAIALLLVSAAPQDQTPNARPRASDLGLKVGVLPTGPLDAITDVAGVEVGHTTIIRGEDIRRGNRHPAAFRHKHEYRDIKLEIARPYA